MSAVALLAQRVATTPSGVALRHHELGIWRPVTWSELGLQVTRLADGLRTLGVESGEVVALIMANNPAWIAADLAIQSLGAVTLAIDPDSPADHACTQIELHKVEVVLCGDQEQFDKVDEAQASGRAASVAMRVVFDTRGMRSSTGLRANTMNTMSFADLESKSTATHWSAPAASETSGAAFIAEGRTFRHADVIESASAVNASLHLTTNDRLLASTSFADPFERALSVTGMLAHGLGLAIGDGGASAASEMTAVQPTLLHAPTGMLDRLGADLANRMGKADRLNRFALARAWRPKPPSTSVRKAPFSILQALGLVAVAGSVLFLWLTTSWTDNRRIVGLIAIALLFAIVAILQGAAVIGPLRRQLGLKRVRAVIGTSAGPGAQMLGALNIPLIDPSTLVDHSEGSAR